MSRLIPKATDLKFTDPQVRSGAARRALPLGLHYLVVQKAERGVIEKEGDYYGTLTLQLRCAALRDPSDADSKVLPLINHSIWLPLSNPNVDGHEVTADWIKARAVEALRAMFEDEIPAYPTRNEDGSLVYKDEVVAALDDGENPEEAMVALLKVEERYREEVYRTVLEKYVELYSDPNGLVGAAYWGDVDLDKTGRFTNVNNMYPDIPANAEPFDWDAHDARQNEKNEEAKKNEEAEKPKPTKQKKKKKKK